MDDLISRQAAIDAINSHFGFNIEEEYGSAVQEVINGLPSAQPEQKKGKWIYPSGIVGFGRCPECKALWDYSLITNRFFRHCPRCGTKIENSPFKDTEREVEE